ncbi:2Fe-2S iron-sulfur cluster-binding protein [Rothia aerolata]|uniref:Ferredoxin n=1 Tax=Rothia aerolata TaxID=1812262 RepID=A0A917IX38_9MICC|nr:2Fe-2S iron-sulfur cluster-binding protein [Rothia aerolata]GGH65333.1 ferredoxin [Rothia aerolata]
MSININVIDENGEERSAEWHEDQTLLEALLANQFPVLATCGGNASCATCHAYIDPEHFASLGERTEAEEDLLDMVDDISNEYSRLSCQTEFTEGMDGATVTLKPGM